MKRFIGLLGWLGVLLVAVAVFLRFSRPEWLVWSQRLALAGLAVTLLYTLSQWRDIARSMQGRNIKYGSIAASSVLLVAAILVGLNWVANRQNKRWDLTTGGEFSLSEQTQRILADLKQPVVIRAFYGPPQITSESLRDQLSEYTYHSKQVTVEYVNALSDPLAAQKYTITAVPTLILEYGGRTERATSATEETLTNALKRVVEGQSKKVYFVQGHGEHDPTETGPTGYTAAADALRDDNFDVQPLTLAQAGSVPADATIVVIAGPKNDLLAPELDALRAYLARGGKVHLMIDPPEKGSSPELTNVIALAHEWGIEVGKNIVVDLSGVGRAIGRDASWALAMPPKVLHPITEKFQRALTAFPFVRSVTALPAGANGRTATQILETSEQSWAESDVAGLYATGKPERNIDGGDKNGPIPIAAAVSAPATAPPAGDTPPPDKPAPDTRKPESRLVVVGDSDFASNSAIGLPGNPQIFMNMANWLAQQENMIAIGPKDPANRPIALTADQGRWIMIFTLALFPLLLIGNAVRVWWRRR